LVIADTADVRGEMEDYVPVMNYMLAVFEATKVLSPRARHPDVDTSLLSQETNESGSEKSATPCNKHALLFPVKQLGLISEIQPRLRVG
jgi:hypothetical protein